MNTPGRLLRVILIGDVVGRYGRQLTARILPVVRAKFRPDLVIANGENSAGGLGIIKRTAEELFAAGIDVITSGNHIWDKKEAIELLAQEKRILRPVNFHPSVPGAGHYLFTTADGRPWTVVNLQGRVFMEPVVDNPFAAIDRFLTERSEPGPVVVDFHAEATAEKQAMAFFLDGRVAAVLGTHTHVPTADARILPKGTAFQCDVGMTGSADSVIGMELDNIIPRFITGIGRKMEVARGNLFMDLTLVDIDAGGGRAMAIQPLRLWEGTYEQQLA